MSSTTFDRRELIVGAGALALASALPVAFAAAGPAVGDATPRATVTDWHIDDMWGVYPRPSAKREAVPADGLCLETLSKPGD